MRRKSLRFLICGGGTGGHIYPAIAIAKTLEKRLTELNMPTRFLFVGARGRMEMKKVPQAGYNIKGLWISGLPRKFSLEAFLFPLKTIYSYYNSLQIFHSFIPDAVIGTGGYVSGIPIHVAHSQNIPVFIQEQNTIPGYTNKRSGWHYAKKIFAAYEESLDFFPKNKTIITGNPVRSEILSPLPNRNEACKKFNLNPEKPVILSIGGSQGARSINDGWLKGVRKLADQDTQLLWQVGERDFEIIRNNPECDHPNIHLERFIDDMRMAYAIADIVVSRAGGLAISELAVLGKPCLFIPLPWAARDHQTKNAQAVVNKNAASMIHNEEIKEKLVDTAMRMLDNQVLQETLSRNILAMSKPQAAETIAEEIINSLWK